MSFTTAMDISTFIWSEQDYNANKNQYYNLLSVAPIVFDQIKKIKTPILLRREACDAIMAEFPYNMIREISYEFETLTLSFLTSTIWFPYTENVDKTVVSVPVLVKQHYSDVVEIETQSQICHLFHNGKNPEHKFIAYNYFFNQESNLVLDKQKKLVELDTLRFNTEEDIIQFFDKYKIKFEHNPKHTNQVRYANGEKISPFTCYHQANGEAKAQKLLEEAYINQGDYFNYDIDNGVFVKFVLTNGLTYHGYDLSDSNDNVPNEIKNKIPKNGREF